jgi:hypothetical protein
MDRPNCARECAYSSVCVTGRCKKGATGALQRPDPEHLLYDDKDDDRPSQICDANHQVVLGCCKICGKAEAELSESCVFVTTIGASCDPLTNLVEIAYDHPTELVPRSRMMVSRRTAEQLSERWRAAFTRPEREQMPDAPPTRGEAWTMGATPKGREVHWCGGCDPTNCFGCAPGEAGKFQRIELRLPKDVAAFINSGPKRAVDALQAYVDQFRASIEPKTVPDLLESAAATFRERNAIYGDNYKHFGTVLAGMFPNGLTIRGEQDFNRLGVFVQVVSKLTRYANNFEKGGHQDSIHDTQTYAAMLEELDQFIPF